DGLGQYIGANSGYSEGKCNLNSVWWFYSLGFMSKSRGNLFPNLTAFIFVIIRFSVFLLTANTYTSSVAYDLVQVLNT
ncbi:MAG: hypothetical protein OCD76_00005, partial [Reichenbachiella sp.]